MSKIRLLLFLLSATALSADPRYTFSLDGKAFDAKVLPVMGARLGAPTRGDLGFIEEVPFVLQGPGHYQFRTGEHGSRFFCKIDEDQEFLALVRIKPHPGAPDPRSDPSDNLTAPQLSKLMGIDLQTPAVQWDQVVKALDGSRTALRLVLAPGTADLPTLPVALRYLTIDASASPELGDLGQLGSLRMLHLLDLTLPDQAEISLEALCSLPNLHNLNVRGGTLIESEPAADQPSLRFLKLRSLKGLDSLAFAAGLPALRVLKVDETDVTDLQPLAGLQELRLLSLNATQVHALPPLDALPALRDLRIHSTPLAGKKELIAPLRPKLNVLLKNWDPAIRAFEGHDLKNPPPERPILFIGSSSIRQWDLEKSFPGLPTLNRGFGGSELSDSLRYFDRLVIPYRPRAILLYAGDNDIGNGETAEQVIADYQAFARKVRSRLPSTHFAYLPIKPSLQRWNLWPEMNRANQAIRELSEADPHLHYLDTATPMLGIDGKPGPDLFVKDGLHLSEAGYALWNRVVQSWLNGL